MKSESKIKMRSKSFENQQGGTKLYALVAIVALGLLIHAGWNYLPAAYQCESFKTEMHTATVQVLAMPHGAEALSDKLKKRIRIAGNENGVPANAIIEVTEANNSIKAHVRFTREINLLPFGLYKYQYQFDNTAFA
jgi:hypothetical protein